MDYFAISLIFFILIFIITLLTSMIILLSKIIIKIKLEDITGEKKKKIFDTLNKIKKDIESTVI